MKQVCLSLGANIGDAKETLRNVVTDLFVEEILVDIQVSSMYETVPIGAVSQPNFFNLTVFAKTNREPLELLDYLQSLETRYGRERTIHWGPRTLDIDIIDVDGQDFHHSRLTLPHPEATKRAFVLVGIAELSRQFRIQGKTVTSWLEEIDTSGVTKLQDEI